jgi:exosortase/archaeosortase family protein
MPMQLVSAQGTAAVSQLIGIPATADGVAVSTRSMQFLVAEECSGLNSLLALLLIGCTAVHLISMRPIFKLLVLALIPPIVLVANVVRLLAVVVTGEFLGPQLALDALVHGVTDVVLYLAALACIMLLAEFLRSRSRTGERLQTPEQAGAELS